MFNPNQLAKNGRANRNLLWIVGGGLVLILFSCVLIFGAAAWLFLPSGQRIATETAANSRSEQAPLQSQQAVEIPTPRVIIEPPENGRDYESAVLANIYAQVNPSVVNVTIFAEGSQSLQGSLLPLSNGSGFIWDTQGHIVTNNHVVDQGAEVQITFSDGTVAIAEIVGTDPDSDLAVLRINPEGYNLHAIQVANIDDVYVGMRVAAIGNPFGLDGTLTSGIVSAIGRSIPAREGFSIPGSIQTDAAINPGNSGGPLLNEQGELIGVNAQIRSDSRSNSGVGFAIPVNIVKRVVPALIERGEYAHSYLGVRGGTISPICAGEVGLPKDLRGAVVTQVLPNTPASRARLRGGNENSDTHYPAVCPSQTGGDIIVAINGEKVTRFDDVLSYLQRFTTPGDTVVLTVWRDGEEVDISLELAPRPERLTQ